MPKHVTLSEVRDAMRAQLALLGAQAWVHLSPRGRVLRSDAASSAPAAAPAAPAPATAPAASTAQTRAVAIARAIDRAARRGIFRPRCLARSIALQRLLRQEGFHGSRVHVGVRAVRGTFEAHAWVTLNGRVVGDESAFVERFSEIGAISIAELR